MRAVIQRVSGADVTVNDTSVGSIGKGLLVFLGVGPDDDEEALQYMVRKTIGLRIFEDSEEKMNLSVSDIGGEILVVPQFTLYGDCRKGRRPSFTDAASPGKAEEYYEAFVRALKERGLHVATGSFKDHMEVDLVNDGPVTMLLDSSRNF